MRIGFFSTTGIAAYRVDAVGFQLLQALSMPPFRGHDYQPQRRSGGCPSRTSINFWPVRTLSGVERPVMNG